MNFRGNRWYKCDLHLHTPESKCFPDKRVSAEDWVQACLDKGLEVVAVTDHNSGNYIDEIIEAAKGTKLTVFPGVEITCDTSKVHLLILFDKDKRSRDINGFLNYCGITEDKFAEQDATAEGNIYEVAEKANSRGAIVIPAHIDEYSGISVTSYQTMQTFLNLPFINGVQVVNEELYNQENYSTQELLEALIERYPRVNEELIREWSNAVRLSKESKKAVLTFSDNPSAPAQSNHGLWGIGNRHTWIKMEEEVSLESLRHALLMPDQKIRNDFDSPSTPYSKPEYIIKGVVINKTVLNPENPIQIQLSPQLNTIIGGRGTGKSAINRIIRGLLDSNGDLVDFSELHNEQSSFFKLSESIGLGEEKKGVLTSETEIELFLERLGRTYKIVHSNFQRGQFNKTVYKLNDEGVFEESNDSILELFRAEIYSQKQIYQIATRPNALREKIDQSIDPLAEHLNSLRGIQDKYFETTAKIRSLKNRIGKKARIELEKDDINERLLGFEEKGYQTILQKQKEAENDNSLLQIITKDLEQKEIRLREFMDELSYLDFDTFEFSAEAADELKTILARNSTEFQEAITKITEASLHLSTAKESLTQAINSSNWNQQFQMVKQEYKTLQEELTAEELHDLGNIEDLSNQLIKKEKELEDIEKNEEELDLLSEELQSLSDSYLRLRKQVTALRIGFLQTILVGTPNIKIEVKQFRDSENYEAELRKVFQRPDRFADDFQIINSFLFNGSMEQKIQELRELITTIKETNQNNARFSGRFNTLIKGLNDEQIDKFRLLYPEDKIEVKYKANEVSEFKSISNASAGQKTSAILTFLLSYGSTPLLLDQPEDDLDNQLIYELIVNRLAYTKTKRQIITITHNANIPVNGDSEWVVAMNSESKDLQVLYEGSIENQSIRDAICNIMEGGSEAFKMRAKRYKLEI
ncbi:TrlF family AAA-like ATPase [Sporosarcina sp. YIM B06819]|uniref:TrlF family AAA-like ATPase n=1 Tax=Sporosarcina sp. YIM B06819 TaxID=3081769 RepID=UPI00298BFE8D|nr:PHP domain-containing protein [Sporosarcina sp. YIM B06819]